MSLTDWDFEIMKTIQKIKKDRLKDPDKVNNKEVDLWENTANKRYTTFRGSVTDEYGWMKMQDPIGDKYLDAMEE